MSSHFKVHELLDRDELDQLEAFAREPGRTIDECHQWLLERGYTLSRGAVRNWKNHVDEGVMRERMSRSSELARVMKDAIAGKDFENVAEAAVMQLTQVVFEQASRLEADGQLDPLDVQRMTRSITNLVGSSLGLKKLLAEKFEKATSNLVSQKRSLTQEDIDEVRKAVFG